MNHNHSGPSSTEDVPFHAEHILEVNSIRGLAMLAVIAVHCNLMPSGWAGVWLFFVISGFIVTRSLISSHPYPSAINLLKNFSRQHWVRIFPVYYAYVVIGALGLLILGYQINPIAFFSLMGFFNNLALIFDMGDLNPWPSSHLWRISIEMQFYLIYGCLFFLLPLRWTIRILALFVLLAPLGRMGLSFGLADLGVTTKQAAYAINLAPLVHFDSFSLGALLAFYGTKHSISKIALPLSLLGLLAVALCGLVYAGIHAHAQGFVDLSSIQNVFSGILAGQLKEVFLYSALAVFFTGLTGLATSRSVLTQWLLGNRHLQWLGNVSYGAYIYHALCIKIAVIMIMGVSAEFSNATLTDKLLVFGLTVLLNLAVAGLSFRYLETPINRYYHHKIYQY